MSEPFIAEIKIFAGNFAPRGWALCNGQLLPIAQNTALFSLVGTTYGGDGRTTFGLPDLQGRAPMHPGRGPGLTSRRLGEAGGSGAVTLDSSQMPAHIHQVRATAAAPNTNSPTGALPAAAPVYEAGDATKTAMSVQSVAPVGGGQPHNNLQPVLTLTFIIALQGLYPSRS